MKNDSFPQIAMNIHSIWNHHLDNLWFVLGSEVWIRRFHQGISWCSRILFNGIRNTSPYSLDVYPCNPWRSLFLQKPNDKQSMLHTQTQVATSTFRHISWPFFSSWFAFVKSDITLLKQLRTGFYSVFYHALDATCTLADMDVVQELGLGVLGLAGNLVVLRVVSLWTPSWCLDRKGGLSLF